MSTSLRTKPGNGKIVIGRVASAHGLHGELAVIPLTDFPERFRSMDSASLYRGEELERVVEVRGVRPGAKGTLTLETNLENRDEAEACVGLEIRVAPEERAALPEGHYWIDDLIGLRVEDTEGRTLGEVSDFLTSAGANPLYEVRDAEGKTHYIPAVEEFIRAIDLEAGCLRVRLIEGLW